MNNTVTLQRPGRFMASSSRRVEDLPTLSGLPLLGSIEGCLTLRGQVEEWRACLKRLGHEHSRVGEFLSPVPARLEETVREKLATVLLEILSISESEYPQNWTGCVLLTSLHHASGAAFGCEQSYLIQLKRTDFTGWEACAPQGQVSDTGELIVADTSQAYTAQQMANAWTSIIRQPALDDVPLSVDPDDFPLF